VGGSARGPGHSLPQPELPESLRRRDARSRGGRWIGRHRGFSSKLQKERYE